MPPHPLTMTRTTILNSVGKFDERYKIAADYDLMLKSLMIKGLKITYLPKTLVNMEAGGISNNSLFNVIISNWEVIRCWYNLKGFIFPFWIFITKPLQKVLQIRRIIHDEK